MVVPDDVVVSDDVFFPDDVVVRNVVSSSSRLQDESSLETTCRACEDSDGESVT